MSDVAAIKATADPWRQACLDRNWDALMQLCTDDVMFSPPDAPRVEHSGVRHWLDGFPTMKVFTFGFDGVDVHGDRATAFGHGRYTLVIDGRDISADFKFVDLFRKTPGGWRYAHVIWNHDAPAS